MATNSKISNTLLLFSEYISSVDIKQDDIQIVKIQKIIHVLSNVKDFRVKGRCVYKLENLIIMMFLAILSGHGSSCVDISEYIALRSDWFEKLGIISDGNIPSHDCFRRLLMNLDTESLKTIIYDYLEKFFTSLESINSNRKSYKQISVDGKQLRGTGRANSALKPLSNLATLNIYNNCRSHCIVAKVIEEKDSEIPVARDELKLLDLRNTIVSFDALHCQKDTAELIAKKKGYYLLIAKDNQKLLTQDIISKIENKKKDVKVISDDKRTYYFYKLPTNFIGLEWYKQKTYVKVESYVRSKTKPETMYFLTNTTNNKLIMEAITNKWQIENDHHRCKDLLLDEDKFRIADKTAVSNMTAFNDIVMALYRISQPILNLKRFKSVKMAYELNPEKYLMMVASIITSDTLIEKIKQAQNKKK